MRRKSHRPGPLRFAAIAPGIALIALLASPAHAQQLGDPVMVIDTYKIAPPYDAGFDLSVHQADWPSVIFHAGEDQTLKDPGGRIDLVSLYDTSGSLQNLAQVWADDTGMFGGQSRMEDQFVVASYVGDLTHVIWAQSFRKDDANATLDIVLTGAQLYVRGLSGQSRAEFTLEVSAYHDNQTDFQHREAAALGIGLGFPPPVTQSVEGAMGWTQTNPDGIGRDSQIDFTGTTVPVDLSGIGVNVEFTVRCELVTEAVLSLGEIVQCHSNFGDPGTATGGVQLQAVGLTPTDTPLDPPGTVGLDLPEIARVSLSAPRPNPGMGAVAFEVNLPRASDVTVDVLDASGRRVQPIAHGRFESGRHELFWNGRDASGRSASAGIYFLRVSAGGFTQSRRIARLSTH